MNALELSIRGLRIGGAWTRWHVQDYNVDPRAIRTIVFDDGEDGWDHPETNVAFYEDRVIVNDNATFSYHQAQEILDYIKQVTG